MEFKMAVVLFLLRNREDFSIFTFCPDQEENFVKQFRILDASEEFARENTIKSSAYRR
jgi:hypothetical protein